MKPEPRDTINTWFADGSHVIKADDDYRRRISNGGPANVYFDEDPSEKEGGKKIAAGDSIVIDRSGFLFGTGSAITVETVEDKVTAKSQKSAGNRTDSGKGEDGQSKSSSSSKKKS